MHPSHAMNPLCMVCIDQHHKGHTFTSIKPFLLEFIRFPIPDTKLKHTDFSDIPGTQIEKLNENIKSQKNKIDFGRKV